jgi:hypothetical protein
MCLPQTSHHTFPKDEELKELWIRSIKKSYTDFDSQNLGSQPLVCSRHFAKNDILGKTKKFLRYNAIPEITSISTRG